MRRLLVLVLAVGMLSGALALWKGSASQQPEVSNVRTEVEAHENVRTIYIDDAAIRAIVVDTPESRQKGLSGRSGLEPDEGMLFVFEADGKYGFWMKDMLFSIDMVWIAADGKIVHIAKSVSPSTYPSSFEPPVPARYVLELPAGYTNAHQIEVGDIVRL